MTPSLPNTSPDVLAAFEIPATPSAKPLSSVPAASQSTDTVEGAVKLSPFRNEPWWSLLSREKRREKQRDQSPPAEDHTSAMVDLTSDDKGDTNGGDGEMPHPQCPAATAAQASSSLKDRASTPDIIYASDGDGDTEGLPTDNGGEEDEEVSAPWHKQFE